MTAPDQPTEAPSAAAEPIKRLPAEWARSRPARRFRVLMEPMGRALVAEQERDEAEAEVVRLTAERDRQHEEIVAAIHDLCAAVDEDVARADAPKVAMQQMIEIARQTRSERDALQAERTQWLASYMGAVRLAEKSGQERDDARAALQEAESREAGLHKSIWRIVSFMEDAPELWGNPAADRVLNCLRALLAAPDRSDGREVTGDE